MRALIMDSPEMPGVIACSVHRAQADIDRDAGGTQALVALAGHFRIRILDRRDHAGDTCGDDRIGARRRLADMRTWFQRHIDRGAARGLASATERHRLGMGTATGLGPTAAYDDAILDHNCADGRIWPGAPLPSPP